MGGDEAEQIVHSRLGRGGALAGEGQRDVRHFQTQPGKLFAIESDVEGVGCTENHHEIAGS